MATVYEAVHQGLRKPVALKVLHSFVAKDPDYLARFLREARAAARLNHPNVVRAYEAGEHEGAYFLAMEYVEGEDLSERIAREGPLDEAEALRVGVEVARALAAAAERGMVHRDVKPENVLLRADGAVKLADLGLAKMQGDGSLTAEGFTLGTVAYFSPEQCQGARDLDVRSDLFALGALLYVALSGELPFGRGENPALTMQHILEQEPPDLGALRPGLSDATLGAVRRLMAKRREDRPADAAQAEALLEAARAGQAPEEPSREAPRRRRKRPRGATARLTAPASGSCALLLLGLSLLAGVATWAGASQGGRRLASEDREAGSVEPGASVSTRAALASSGGRP